MHVANSLRSVAALTSFAALFFSTAARGQSEAQGYPPQTGFIRAEPPTADAGPTVTPPPRSVLHLPSHTMPPVPYADAGLPQPTSPPTALGVAGPGAPCDVIQRANVNVAPAGGGRGTVAEPTVAFRGTNNTNATVGFYTANWFAALSTDSGGTWTYVNPYTKFPAVDGGFCCDQVCLYEPCHDMMVWYLQYVYSASTQRGSARVAYAIGNNIAGNTWSSYVFSPQFFGRPAGEWLDYPDMAVSEDRIFFTSNIFNAAGVYQNAVIWTMTLAQFAAGSGSVGWWFTSNIGGGGSVRFTRGAGATIYGGTHASTARMRIFKITSGSLTTIERDHPAWAAGPYSSICPNGVNWAARTDSRITGAYQTASEYGFLWTASATTGRAQPYARVSRYRVADDTLIQDDDIWASTFAFLYPSAAANDAGHKAFVVAAGGGVNSGASSHPSTFCGLVDDCYGNWFGQTVQQIANANASPNGAVWGDYYSVQRHPVRSLSFVGSGMGQVGGGGDANQATRFAWFGRERDNPAWVTVAVHSSPVQGVPIACQSDNLGRTSVTSLGYASYNANTNYILTAPLVHTASGRVYRFQSWRYRGAPCGPLAHYSTVASTLFLNDDRDDVAEAVYQEARQLDVGSRNPTSGVAITASPNDVQGNGNGTSAFTRYYLPGANVTLTAPATFNTDHPFKVWWLNGVAQPLGNRTLVVNVVSGSTPISAEAEYFTHVHGTVATFGAGCPGSNSQNPLLSVSHPDAGTNVTFTVSNVFGATGGSVYLGASRTTYLGIPLPINLSFLGTGPACFLRSSPDISLSIAIGTGGTGSVVVPFPSSLGLGSRLYSYSALIDPLVATPLKVIVSNAVEITIGGNQ